jgi:uncharacterized surface protein with fasciclin (FAS1) repeats
VGSILSPSSVPNIATLAGVLNYHTISSTITSDKLAGGAFATVQGARISTSNQGGTFRINANNPGLTSSGNGATVVNSIALDIAASNGVIHAIDRVLIPVANANIWITSLLNFAVNYGVSPPAVTVYGTVLRRVAPVAPSTTPGPINLTDAAALAPVDASGTNYNLLSMAIARAEMATVIIPIAAPFPDFTVFAPNDAAFVSFLGVADEAAARTAINNLTPAALADIVRYHVVPGRVLSTDLSNSQSVTTALTGGAFTVNIAGSVITLTDKNAASGDATVQNANILTNAGVLHQINGVLRSN